MSNATPGWYPDPWNPSAQRFWDGARWTEHVAAAGGPSDRPRLPEGAPIYGALIWVLALLPLLDGVMVWFIHIDAAQFAELMQSGDGSSLPTGVGIDPFSLFGAGYWVTVALSPLLYAAYIVLAALDHRRLVRLGVVRPFHWAWAFIPSVGSLVYVIGRCVIVRKVAAPRGLAPLWVLIGSYLVALVSGAIWSSIFVNQLLDQVNQIVNGYPTS